MAQNSIAMCHNISLSLPFSRWLGNRLPSVSAEPLVVVVVIVVAALVSERVGGGGGGGGGCCGRSRASAMSLNEQERVN